MSRQSQFQGVAMAKVTAKKKTSAANKATKSALKKAKKKAAVQPTKPVAELAGDKLTFNHAMVYAKDVQRALGFYRELLGFRLVDEFRHEGRPVYARLRAPGGDGTIALHLAGPGTSLASDGVRLYFEIRELDDFCRKLQAKGFYITQMPRMMPWGWRHAYLNDPDGHEISLYWAGENRMKKTVMRTAQEVDKMPRRRIAASSDAAISRAPR
jgi:catechol 2,3-dioxygenase-like lactoylglutathione lyase family enzyme